MVASHPPAPRDLPGRLGTGALLQGGGEPRYRHRQCPAAGGSGGTGPGLLGAAVPLRAVPGVGRQLQPRSAGSGERGAGSGAAPPLPAVLQRAPDPRCRAMAAPRQEVSLQAPVTFEDVEVRFSAEEWELLEEWQRALHREVTEGTSQLLASLGPPSSPALGALVQLVKEIPKFLFGGPKAGTEPGATSRDAAAGSEQTGAGGEHRGCAGWVRAWSCPAGHRRCGGSALVMCDSGGVRVLEAKPPCSPGQPRQRHRGPGCGEPRAEPWQGGGCTPRLCLGRAGQGVLVWAPWEHPAPNRGFS
ncbi:protein KRBA1 [Morphnus guianensis]